MRNTKKNMDDKTKIASNAVNIAEAIILPLL